MEIRVTYSNTTNLGGTFVTPVWFGLHDDGFDIFNIGEEVSPGVESIAEDGEFDTINEELSNADPDAQSGLILGPNIPPIGPRETGDAIITVDDAEATQNLSFAAMLLPSNDAFFGSSDTLEIFDEDGDFLGAQAVVITGNEIYDAGTEVNTELDAAFLNQTDPDTGIDQGGVVQRHPGFIGSEGNPASEFGQEILGGTTVIGAVIDPVAGDFTIDRDAPVGIFHVNEVERFTGDDGTDIFFGSRKDDIVSGEGGTDILFGRGGWDVIHGGDGSDFIAGNRGNDLLYGGEGTDILRGGIGDDTVLGGADEDVVRGNRGNDVVSGGAGNDFVFGGLGEDVFVIEADADIDLLRDFRSGEDIIDLSAFGTSFDELNLEDGPLSNGAAGVTIELNSATVEIQRASSDQLTADDFFFG